MKIQIQTEGPGISQAIKQTLHPGSPPLQSVQMTGESGKVRVTVRNTHRPRIELQGITCERKSATELVGGQASSQRGEIRVYEGDELLAVIQVVRTGTIALGSGSVFIQCGSFNGPL